MRDDSSSGGYKSETDAARIDQFGALCVGFTDCVI